MKSNKRLLTGIFVLAFLSWGLCVIAETVEQNKGYISANASESKEIAPNLAEISIGIMTSDISLQKASEDNKLIANKIYSSLKALLGPQDYIKTSNYSAKPQYIHTKDNKRILDKYVVENSVLIKTKNIGLVSKLIDKAISQGATGVDNLQFLAEDYDCECNEMLAKLTKKTYLQADMVAKSINSQIIGIKSIDTSCNAENASRPYYGMMAMKSAMDSESATPIESGKIKIYANVNASFYVK